MTTAADFAEARKAFHASLLQSTLTINSAGVVSNADSSNTTSKAIAKGIADLLKAETIGERIAGQTSGAGMSDYPPALDAIPGIAVMATARSLRC